MADKTFIKISRRPFSERQADRVIFVDLGLVECVDDAGNSFIGYRSIFCFRGKTIVSDVHESLGIDGRLIEDMLKLQQLGVPEPHLIQWYAYEPIRLPLDGI